jgi:hypothetical protein
VDTGQPREPDLTRARAEVMAIVAGSPMSMGAPTAQAVAPLSALPPAVEAKLAVSGSTGVLPTRAARPGGDVRRRVVVPSASLALVDAVLVVVGLVSGHYLLAAIAGALFVPLTAIAVLAARFAGGDAARLTLSDKRAINQAARWRSKQPWTGPLASGAERGLVLAAVRAAERIAATASWRSGRIDDQRVRLDLAAELDQIDDQAHRIAVSRNEYGPAAPGTAPVIDSAWDATLNRVAALTAYADQLDGSDQRRIEAAARQGDPVRDSNLMAGSVLDEMAADELVALTYYLSANRDGTSGDG